MVSEYVITYGRAHTAVREEFLCTHVGLAYAHVGTVSQKCSGT